MNIFSGINGITWGQIVYKAHATYGPRWLASYQLMLVHTGSAEVVEKSRSVLVRAGEAAFLIPGREQLFRFSDTEPTHHSWIHAEFDPETDGWSSLRAGGIRVLPLSQRMKLLMEELLRISQSAGQLQRELGESMARSVILEFFGQAGFSFGGGEPGHPGVRKAVEFIRKRLREGCDLPGIAAAAGLSQQHLSRLFRKELGRSPVAYLWFLRESEGSRLLRETGLTITQIADACGFQNPYHFTRRIRQRYGIPPRALRLRHWGGGQGSE